MAQTAARRHDPRPGLAILAAIFLAVACDATGGTSASVSELPATPSTAPVSSAPGPTATEAESAEFVLPTPGCPAPPDAVRVPNITVSVGGGPGILVTPGSSMLATCTTTATSDSVPLDPVEGLVAHPGDRMSLSLPPGWRFLRGEGSDSALVGDGAKVWPPVDTPPRPGRVDVPVPPRSGDSRAAFTFWIVSVDGRVVGQLDVLIRVRVG